MSLLEENMSQYIEYKYETVEPGNGKYGKRLADKIIAVIQNCPNVTSILDLGCGNGYLASRLACLGYKVTGVDASQSGIELARMHNSFNNLEFVCANINADLANAFFVKFDLILSSDVIEHMYRPADLIDLATSLLQVSGHLIVVTPYHGYIKNLLLAVLNKWDAHHGVGWDGGHIKFFSVKTLRDLFEKYGYEDISFTYYGRVHLLYKNMICLGRKP